MRIAVASDDGAGVAAHTGRCAGFVVFDIGAQEAARVEYRVNTFTAHAQGQCQGTHSGAGEHHSHGALMDALSDCSVLVTRGLGPRLIADLASRGIEAYVCEAERAEEAAQQFAAGRLARATGCGCCRHM